VPTYASGSVELQAFTELNNFRKMVGLGLLAQNSKIDSAAANHANYISQNIDTDLTVFGHYEVATKAGYTGVAPGDRTAFTSYGPVASEVATSNNYSDQQSPIQRFLDRCITVLPYSHNVQKMLASAFKTIRHQPV